MKIILRFLFSFLFLAVVLILFLGYLGVIPTLSGYLGSNKPRDLGIRVSEKTIKETPLRVKTEQKTLTKSANPPDSISFMGNHTLEGVFTNEEMTFIVNDQKWIYYPVYDVQIKMEGRSAEISGMVRTDRILNFVAATGGSKYDIAGILNKIKIPAAQTPFYVKGMGSAKNNVFLLDVQKLEFGRIPIPIKIVRSNRQYIENFFNERENFIREAYLESATIENGKLNFKGTVPDIVGTENE